MRVLLSTYGSRGDVEPMVAPAVRLRALGAEARVCAPPDEEFAEQPALIDDGGDCSAVGEVNQQALFGRVAAVAHHGGAGTTTTAARAGAPRVVVPQIVDQPYWAGRVAHLGIGAAHDGPTPTTEPLSAALTTAPASGSRARAVAATIRADGTTVAAELLLDTVSRGRSPVSA